MKIFSILAILICFPSCNRQKKNLIDRNEETKIENQIVKPQFQSILDSAGVVGAILLYDFQKHTYYSNDFERAKEGRLPASTFKIPNSIIGLETGVIKSDTTIFEWDGQEKGNDNWEQDLILKDAFRLSCVPCYREVARKIGAERMNDYLQKLDYRTMDVDSNNIDMFWLEGNSRITPMGQINFLKRLYTSELPILERTTNILRKMMLIEKTEKYRLYGKTGLSNTNHGYNGWFVGFIERGDNTYFFATNIEPKDYFDYERFVQSRSYVTFEALGYLQIID